MFQKIFEKFYFVSFLLREGTKRKKRVRDRKWLFYQNIYALEKRQLVYANHTTGMNSNPISCKLHPTDVFIFILLSFFQKMASRARRGNVP